MNRGDRVGMGYHRFKLVLGSVGIIAAAVYAGPQNASALTLQEAVKTAIENHPQVESQKAKSRASEHIVRQARSGFFPSVDVRSAAGIESVNSPTTRSRASRNRSDDDSGKRSVTQLTYRNNLTVRQPIFDGFLASSQTDSAKAQLRSERETTHNVELDVALRAVESYIEIIRTQRLLSIAADNVAEHERIFGLVEKRAVTGPGLGSDVDQATARLALAQASRERIFGELRNAEADFVEAVGVEQFAVGESGVDINQLEEPNMPESLVPSSLSSALERSAQNHPAIKAADESIQEAEAEIEVAEAPYYPRVDGELMVDLDKNLSGQPGKNHTFSALGVMRWNLYSGGRDTARRRETIELLMQAKQDRLDVERRIAESVRKSWSLWITSKRRLRQLEKQADAVARVVQVFEQQFQVGGRTLLDVLDEKNELFVTKSGVATERYRELFARYELLARTGEMLKVMGFKGGGNPAPASSPQGGQQSESPPQQPQPQRGEG